MRSNVTVGPPIDLLLYKRDSLRITRYRRLGASDPDLNLIHASWEQSLRRAVEQLPEIEFEETGAASAGEPVQAVAVEPVPRPSAGSRPDIRLDRCIGNAPLMARQPCAHTVRS